jgi:hypothetical protein
MARTQFALTADNEDTSYPDDIGRGAASSGNTNQAIDRYVKAGFSTKTYQYPLTNDSYNVPFLRFLFLDAYGNLVTQSPRVFIRMPPTFNVTGFSEYSRTESIFGASTFYDLQTTAFDEQKTQEGFDAARFGLTAAEALRYALQKGFANVQGFIGSGGLNNIAQYEFSQRQAVNPFAQMLYKGPQYRRYQIPVMIRPKNRAEAENAMNIISIFRVASSPSVHDTSGVFNGLNIGEGTSFTFGYPHLTQFNVVFYKDTSSVQNIFRSKSCAIESVSVDYGGQKLTFFEDGVPTEMNFTLQLTEITPRTLGDARSEARDSNITMR